MEQSDEDDEGEVHGLDDGGDDPEAGELEDDDMEPGDFEHEVDELAEGFEDQEEVGPEIPLERDPGPPGAREIADY